MRPGATAGVSLGRSRGAASTPHTMDTQDRWGQGGHGDDQEGEGSHQEHPHNEHGQAELRNLQERISSQGKERSFSQEEERGPLTIMIPSPPLAMPDNPGFHILLWKI